MGCGASTQAAIKEKAVAAYDNAKETAAAAVSQGKYYVAGCKFDPDAQGLQKNLAALEKGVKSANASYETWAKKVRPLSSALINHWADTTTMPQAAKDELKAAAAIISGAGRAHKGGARRTAGASGHARPHWRIPGHVHRLACPCVRVA